MAETGKKQDTIAEIMGWSRSQVSQYAMLKQLCSHRDYMSNSVYGGKYRQHSHFIRVLKGLEAFHLYVDAGDIVVLPSYARALESCPELGQIKENNALRDAFRAINNHALYLVNATRYGRSLLPLLPNMVAIHQRTW